MSRDVTVRDMQKVIADMHAYCETTICPDWAKPIVKHMAMLLEDILCNRDASQSCSRADAEGRADCDYCGISVYNYCPRCGKERTA